MSHAKRKLPVTVLVAFVARKVSIHPSLPLCLCLLWIVNRTNCPRCVTSYARAVKFPPPKETLHRRRKAVMVNITKTTQGAGGFRRQHLASPHTPARSHIRWE